MLEQQFAQVFKFLLSDAEKELARVKFERHFGAIELGFVANVDNESIDADLVEESACIHKEE